MVIYNFYIVREMKERKSQNIEYRKFNQILPFRNNGDIFSKLHELERVRSRGRCWGFPCNANIRNIHFHVSSNRRGTSNKIRAYNYNIACDCSHHSSLYKCGISDTGKKENDFVKNWKNSTIDYECISTYDHPNRVISSNAATRMGDRLPVFWAAHRSLQGENLFERF